MEYVEGKSLTNYPNSISLKGTEIILEQMKSSVCKIYINQGFKCTGFFCKIIFNESILPALITCNHVINELFLEREKKITISISNRYKNIELDERIKYTNKIYDITIIELKEQDGINSFLDFDDIFYDNDKISSINKSIYTLHYSKNKNIEVSYGIILDEENYFRFNHSCSTGKGSAGAPILDLSTHKIISIHVGGNKDKDCNIPFY